jgi:hypothetical protein
MEAICFSETSVVTQQTTRRHIPEDDTHQVNKLDRMNAKDEFERIWSEAIVAL